MSNAEILPDGVGEDGAPTWGIVCDREFPTGAWCGRVRPPGDLHAGKFVYPFSNLKMAEYALADMEQNGNG